MSLTLHEQETVINMSDGDDTVRLWTAQRTVIRACENNPDWTMVRSGWEDTTRWAEFTIPKRLFRFGSKRRVSFTAEQRAAAGERLRRIQSRQVDA
jgi:hypothetical protein